MAEPQLDSPSLFAGLTDVGFRTFVTRKFLSVIYIVLAVGILLTAIAFFASAASQGGRAALVALVVVPLVALLYLVMARVSLELVALMFRIAENTDRMAAALEDLSAAPAVEYEEIDYVDDPRVVYEDEYDDEEQYAPPPRRR